MTLYLLVCRLRQGTAALSFLGQLEFLQLDNMVPETPDLTPLAVLVFKRHRMA